MPNRVKSFSEVYKTSIDLSFGVVIDMFVN